MQINKNEKVVSSGRCFQLWLIHKWPLKLYGTKTYVIQKICQHPEEA